MFETTFSQVSELEISSSISEEAIIQLMHDFTFIAKLNPDCLSIQLVRQQSENTWEYKVEDSLAFIPNWLWSGGVSYTAIYSSVPDGCDIIVKAPGGFTSSNRWRSVQLADGKRAVRIKSDATCSKTFSAFVRRDLVNSHGQQLRAFKDKVGQRTRPEAMGTRSSWPEEHADAHAIAA